MFFFLVLNNKAVNYKLIYTKYTLLQYAGHISILCNNFEI